MIIERACAPASCVVRLGMQRSLHVSAHLHAITNVHPDSGEGCIASQLRIVGRVVSKMDVLACTRSHVDWKSCLESVGRSNSAGTSGVTQPPLAFPFSLPSAVLPIIVVYRPISRAPIGLHARLAAGETRNRDIGLWIIN